MNAATTVAVITSRVVAGFARRCLSRDSAARGGCWRVQVIDGLAHRTRRADTAPRPSYAEPAYGYGADAAAALRAFRTADLQRGGGHIDPVVLRYLRGTAAARLVARSQWLAASFSSSPASVRPTEDPPTPQKMSVKVRLTLPPAPVRSNRAGVDRSRAAAGQQATE